jgi:hypothetical protein
MCAETIRERDSVANLIEGTEKYGGKWRAHMDKMRDDVLPERTIQ